MSASKLREYHGLVELKISRTLGISVGDPSSAWDDTKRYAHVLIQHGIALGKSHDDPATRLRLQGPMGSIQPSSSSSSPRVLRQRIVAKLSPSWIIVEQ